VEAQYNLGWRYWEVYRSTAGLCLASRFADVETLTRFEQAAERKNAPGKLMISSQLQKAADLSHGWLHRFKAEWRMSVGVKVSVQSSKVDLLRSLKMDRADIKQKAR
jgi:hypothetical protein